MRKHPDIFHVLRLSTAPPLSQSRIEGLANVSGNVVSKLECGRLPSRMNSEQLDLSLESISKIIKLLFDYDIFSWIPESRKPTRQEKIKAEAIIGDRLCSSLSDPIVRNAQEERQLDTITEVLRQKGYRQVESADISSLAEFPTHCYAIHYNVPVRVNGSKTVNIPVDLAVKSQYASMDSYPVMIECKSAGDYTNTNKRRKEEAIKIEQLRNTYGDTIRFILYLCGYFDTGYLGYEAAEGIDWIWEHKPGDLEMLDL